MAKEPTPVEEEIEDCVYHEVKRGRSIGSFSEQGPEDGNLIRPVFQIDECGDDSIDYEKLTDEEIAHAMQIATEAGNRAARHIDKSDFIANDTLMHMGLAGMINNAGREAEARGLHLIGCNIELAYEDDNHDVYTFDKRFRNMTRLDADNN